MRPEEHLQGRVAAVATARYRMRKYVVTETETIAVPVRRERVVLEEVPLTVADVDGPVDVLGVFAARPTA